MSRPPVRWPRTVLPGAAAQLYDEWKKSCGAGRLVDLDKLIAWCAKRAGDREKSA